MSSTRRHFIQTSAAAIGSLGLGSLSLATAFAQEVKTSSKPLRLLILGGTGFIGPHMVQTALDRGHEVTIFNRGKSNPHLFPEVEKLKIDVRDLSEFCLHLVERDTAGVFNGAGPSYSELSMQEFIYAVRGVTSSKIDFTWIDEKFLAEHGIEHFGFPLWISVNSEYKGLTRVSIERSVKQGLKLRPLAVTAHDTLEWFKSQDQERQDKLQLQLDRDAEVLKAWHSKD